VPGVGCPRLLAELEASGSGTKATWPSGPSTLRLLISRPPSSSKSTRSASSSMPRLISWPMQASGVPEIQKQQKIFLLDDKKGESHFERRHNHTSFSLTMMPLYLNPVGSSDRVDENVSRLKCLVLSSSPVSVFPIVGGTIM
jgi:hypothetical protein